MAANGRDERRIEQRTEPRVERLIERRPEQFFAVSRVAKLATGTFVRESDELETRFCES